MRENNFLIKKSLSGVLWTFLDVCINKIGFFLTTLYLARILGPEVYGLIGMITIFITIGNSLVDSGMSVSLIRMPQISKLDISSVFFGNLFVSIVVYLVLFFLSPSISSFYNQDILLNVIRVYCLVFIISAFRVVQTAIIIRNLDFKKNTLLTIPAVLISIFIGVFLAKEGYGIWSVVFMYISQQSILTFLLWYFTKERIDIVFSFNVLKKHFSFGYKLTISGLLNTACNNFNNILIGKYYPLQLSGYYERAYSLNQYPVSVFTAIISKVSLPILSKIQSNRSKVISILHYLIKYSFFVMSLLMLFMIVFAKEIVMILLGKDWIDTAPYLQVISIACVFMPIHTFNVNIMQIYGRSDLFLKSELIKKIFQITCIVMLFKFGIFWMISSLVFTSIFELFINAYFVKKIISFGFKKQFFIIIKPLLLFLLVLSCSFYVKNSKLIVSSLSLKCVLIMFLAVLLYLLYFIVFNNKDFCFLKNKVKNKL